MRLHTVVFDELGSSTARGCQFSLKNRNILLPASSQNPECVRVFDIATMTRPTTTRIYDAFFSKRIRSFVADRDVAGSIHKVLVILAIYGEIEFKTDDHNRIVFHKNFHMVRGNKEHVQIRVICLDRSKEFAFELVDPEGNDEPRSCFLKYSKSSDMIDVVDLFEENHRHKPQPESLWQRVGRYLWKQVCNTTYNYFRPLGKWRS